MAATIVFDLTVAIVVGVSIALVLMVGAPVAPPDQLRKGRYDPRRHYGRALCSRL